MCCLFGFIDYAGALSVRQKNRLIRELSIAAEARGTDAAGIAYNTSRGLQIYKRPLAAYRLHLRIPAEAHVIMGHTRMATQGSAKKNYNNHPFFGYVKGKHFALAHNGVLWNDRGLRHTKHLPKTKIQTDSYVAVQLLEQQKVLDFDSLAKMAEQVEGSFSFAVLDQRENLYFVKGDNPLCLYFYPHCGLYLYASTEAILNRALKRLHLPIGKPERVELNCGDILKLRPTGQMERASFDVANLLCPWSSFSLYPVQRGTVPQQRRAEQEYLDTLKGVAAYYGYEPSSIDELLDVGFSTDEIEELLYERMIY